MLTDYHLHLQPDGVAARAEQADRWDAAGGHLSRGLDRPLRRPCPGARRCARSRSPSTSTASREARDWHPNPWWREEATEDVDAYCAALERARAEGLPVLVGVEMDWLPDRADEIARVRRAAARSTSCSARCTGSRERAVDHPDYLAWDALDAEEVWARYLDELVAAARSGLFDVLAHIDLPKVFGHAPPESARDALARGRSPRSPRRVSRSNARPPGLRKPVGELYPNPELLALCAAAGIPVTLSSDAHRPEDVAADYPTAVAALARGRVHAR